MGAVAQGRPSKNSTTCSKTLQRLTTLPTRNLCPTGEAAAAPSCSGGLMPLTTTESHMTCPYCHGSSIPGVHLPSDFDDRADSRDGRVYVAACDACGTYPSDLDAARAVHQHTGWPVLLSFDVTEAISLQARREAKGQTYFRPYFAVSLKDAVLAHKRESPYSSRRKRKTPAAEA